MPIARDGVVWSNCQSLTIASPTKMAEVIELSPQKGAILMGRPIVKYRDCLLTCCHTYSAAVTSLADTACTYSGYSGPRGGAAA